MQYKMCYNITYVVITDDEYFFLKLFDLSRKDYVRNMPSHKICD